MLSFCGMLIFFKVSMDSGTEYYFLEGEFVTVIVFLLKKSIDVMLFVSFIHSLFYHIHHDV